MSDFFNPDGPALTSNKSDWETPQKLFDELDARYHFDLDAAASNSNHKVDTYFTAVDDALNQLWSGNVFVNPPYDRNMRAWVEKAYNEAQRDKSRVVVMLIPSRTDTSYWHDFIFGHAHIEYLRGRLKSMEHQDSLLHFQAQSSYSTSSHNLAKGGKTVKPFKNGGKQMTLQKFKAYVLNLLGLRAITM